MSDVDTHSGVPDSDMLAAEYVLGVLGADERTAAERRIVRDAFFARAVGDWENRLLPWANTVESVPPPPQVWERILDAIQGTPARRAMPEMRAGWWSGLNFWRGLAAGTTALAAASIAALFIMLRAPAPLPLTASIDGGGHRHFIATIDPARGQMVVSPAAFAAVPDRVPELWLIVPGNAPHALGLLNADRAVTITIPDNLRAHTNTNASLAVSIEPPGGSPTGAPTGPVVAQGKLTSL